MIRLAAFIAFFLALCATSMAHELRPGFLEIRQLGAETYNVRFKVPARGDMRLGLFVRLPENCTETSAPGRERAGGAFVENRTLRCASGLDGREITIDGLQATYTDVVARVARQDGSVQAARLTPDNPRFVVAGMPAWSSTAWTYFILGVEHILAGVDHLLFVMALLLIVSGWRRLLVTITSFTIAHSITLAAATFGVIWVPGPPVEAVIALSIMFLASELIRIGYGEGSLTARFPWVVAFVFGLLHGLGFAGALAEVGLPQSDIPLALLMFNVGVEAGQVLFVAAVLAVVWCLRRLNVSWPNRAKQVPAYGIGTISAFWLVERISGFW